MFSNLDKIGYAAGSMFVVSQAAPPDITPYLNGGALAVLTYVVVMQQRQNSKKEEANTEAIKMLLEQKAESEKVFAAAISGMSVAINNLSTTCALAQAKSKTQNPL